MKLNVTCNLIVLTVLAVTGATHAEVIMHGVLSAGSHTASVDTADIWVDTLKYHVVTSGWAADTMELDSFDFPSLPAWPSRILLFATINGGVASLDLLTPARDSWYLFPGFRPPNEPKVLFFDTSPVEETHGHGVATTGLAAAPTLVGSRTAFQVHTPRTGRFALNVYDAAGNLVRVLSSQATGNVTLVPWTGDNETGQRLPEGMYYCSLVQRGASAVCKVVLAR